MNRFFILFLSLNSLVFGQNLQVIKEAALKGDTNALNKLALIYLQDSLLQDYNKAFYYFSKSAENENSYAQNYLGVLYSNGLGVKEDKEKAMYWYERSAEQGNSLAQSNLGWEYFEKYRSGKGTIADKRQAFFWFTKSAEQGDTHGQYGLAWYYFQYSFKLKEEEENNIDAITSAKKDQEKVSIAVQWFQECAKKGDADCQRNLAEIYSRDDPYSDPFFDEEVSFYWYKKCAENGVNWCQHELINLYDNGIGTLKDPIIAFEWCKLCAEQGDGYCQYLLGMRYYYGNGVAPDFERCAYWMRMAYDSKQLFDKNDVQKKWKELELWKYYKSKR